MSSYLGPIHYWLYNKIKMQQTIVNGLFTLGKKYGIHLDQECDEKFGVFFDKPLENMIDQDNIHGWLQDKVSRVEYKYAYCVTRLLTQTPTTIDQLKSLLYQKGKELGSSFKEEEVDAPFIYKAISDNLLDGMPCDHANSVIDENDNEIIWKRNLCVHSRYWEETGGDVSVYYELRDAWIEGLLNECGFTLSKIDSVTYHIEKQRSLLKTRGEAL